MTKRSAKSILLKSLLVSVTPNLAGNTFVSSHYSSFEDQDPVNFTYT